MKKILVTGLLALGALALVQQDASAWVNSKFGIGLNWDYQSGGNNLLWGAYRNGQPAGPEAYGHHGHRHGMPQPFGFAPQGQPNYGAAPQGFAPVPQGYVPAPQFAPPPTGAFAPRGQQPISMQPIYYGSPYQYASYPRPLYYYPTPYYYYAQ